MSRSALSKTKVETDEQDRIKLLIIEDDNVHRMIIKRFASALGFAIAEASTYESAIALLADGSFDCVTLDLSIRARSGIDVLCHLREIGRRIPVLIISGADETKRLETAAFAEAMNFTVLHVMKKPLDLHALQKALAKLKTFVHINNDVQAAH